MPVLLINAVYLVGFIYFQVSSWLHLLFPLTLIVFFIFIIDYYIEAVAVNHLQPTKAAAYGHYAIAVSAFLLALLWNHPMTAQITTINKLREIITADHVISYGVIFSLGSFMLGNTAMILSFRTDWSEQTVQTQIRLLLEEQSDQGLHCLPFCLHRLDSLLYGRVT